MNRKLLIVQVAALGHDLLQRNHGIQWNGPTFRPIDSVFPAVTCTVQASFRTASPPAQHGMIANGLYFGGLGRPMFWEQSARLIDGRRIWENFHRPGRRVGMLFWQQSFGEEVEVLLSPAPIHKHHGRMIQDCYCRPAGLYARLCGRIGRPFRLQHYWGPRASAKAGDWIASATAAVMTDELVAPELLLTYLPTLDYSLQRFGPRHKGSARAVRRLLDQLRRLMEAARVQGYEVLIFGDYAMGRVNQAVFPNRALREAGLMATRTVKRMLYPDFHAGRAFAVVDHEIAHVYVKEPADVDSAREVLAAQPGVARILDREAQRELDVDHLSSGKLILIAQTGKWFAYPWWTDKREAPDYAAHVDIHNKPGYDPCELFLGWPPTRISQDTGRVRGSHGRIGPDRQVAWASTISFDREPASLINLAALTREWLNNT